MEMNNKVTNKLVTIFSNRTKLSKEWKKPLMDILIQRGFDVTMEYKQETDLIVCIGGDGSFLEAIHNCNFPDCPIVGINTGHLGFYQEIQPEQLEDFFDDYINGNYKVQELNAIKCNVTLSTGKVLSHFGLNEITVMRSNSSTIHMDISIDDDMIERFSGDGIIVSTSSGSTAYNYSLGGSIVDPRIKAMQITPIAPINTTAYRSLTSSIMLPSDLPIDIIPESSNDEVCISNDGIETVYRDVTNIEIVISEKAINLIRFQDYNFWNKVKSKFL